MSKLDIRFEPARQSAPATLPEPLGFGRYFTARGEQYCQTTKELELVALRVIRRPQTPRPTHCTIGDERAERKK